MSQYKITNMGEDSTFMCINLTDEQYELINNICTELNNGDGYISRLYIEKI